MELKTLKPFRFFLVTAVVVSTTAVIVMIYSCYSYVFVFQPFRFDSDLCWLDDSLTRYIEAKKRFPENWEELKNNASKEALYAPIEGIESRVDLNFELMKKINLGEVACMKAKDNDENWAFRYGIHSKTMPKKLSMKNYCTILQKNHPKQDRE